MKTRIIGLLLLTAYGSLLTSALAQVPVTVNRSTILSGSSVDLPTFSSYTTTTAAETSDLTYSFLYGYFTTPTDPIASVTGNVSVTPTAVAGSPYYSVFMSATPVVVIATNAPSTFTNTLTAVAAFHALDHGGNWTGMGAYLSQTYVFTVIDGTGGVNAPSATLTSQIDPLESVSRKDASAVVRKLLGFQLTASTNAVLTSFAAAIYNTTTNGNLVEPIGFYRAAPGDPAFDGSSVLLATTTNSGGFAIFTGLAEPITASNQTYFIAGQFLASNQTRNSFISASLNPQNIIVTLAGTNAVIGVNGGSVLGKQYAFLDTTVAEDAAAAAALAFQIDTAVAGATNSLSLTYANNLNQATNALAGTYADQLTLTSNNLAATWSTNLILTTNALTSSFASQLAVATNGLGGSTVINNPKKSGWPETVLPAAAAGAAGIGAAVTIDSLNERPLSKEFQPKPSD